MSTAWFKLKGFKFIHQLTALVVLVSLPLIFYWRVILVDSTIGRKFGLDGAYDAAVLNADGPLLVSIGVLILGSWFIKNYMAGVMLRIFALTLVLLYIVDLIVFKQYGIRVLFSSIQLYGSQGAAIWDQLQVFLGGKWKALGNAALFGVFVIALVFMPRKPWKVSIFACLLLTFSATIASVMPWKVNYVNSWIIQNFLSANLLVSNTKIYSSSYIEQLAGRSEAAMHCQSGLSRQKNVIILIVESLSAYQSQLYGGVNDWTPEMDALSSQAVVFNNMHATSFSTNEGLIGILGGVRLFSPFSHLFRAVVPFETAWGLENTLPREFNAAGYHTAFLTLGSLGITRKGDWITDIGFQEMEGSESPFYVDWPVVQYKAAADEALYALGLDWIGSRQPGQPWMLTLLTISTHQPYRHPQTRVPDLEQTFRYADREAAKFVRELQGSGFFDNGILLVLGDHRSMTPVSKKEERIFGTSASARVQFALFGEGGPEKHDGVFHHSDLLPSFRNWLNEESCEQDSSFSIFDPDSEGRCAFHVRGSQPSLVDIFCPEGQGLVKLDGDSTRFINSDGISNKQQAVILHDVANERLTGHQRHLDYLETR
jgi:lipoteichoic acid synthase